MTAERDARQYREVRRRFLTNGGNAVAVSVANLATDVDVTFTIAEPDASYAVLVTPSWLTTFRVTNKATTGFTVEFGTAAGASDSIDYAILRA